MKNNKISRGSLPSLAKYYPLRFGQLVAGERVESWQGGSEFKDFPQDEIVGQMEVHARPENLDNIGQQTTIY